MDKDQAILLAYSMMTEDYYSGSSKTHYFIEEEKVMELIEKIYASLTKQKD
jgi:hypothetical protein